MTKESNINDWEKIALEELKGIKTDQLIKETPEGIKVKPLYTKDDLEDLKHEVICFLLEKLHYFKVGKGKAFSY